MAATTTILTLLAALVWYTGGIILLIKGRSMLIEADALQPEAMWHRIGALAGIVLGSVKAKYLFCRSCRKNLRRIAALNIPRWWQFYKPGFFILLTLMIILGAAITHYAHANYYRLIAVGILDLSIAIGLLGSSHTFWKFKKLTVRSGTNPTP